MPNLFGPPPVARALGGPLAAGQVARVGERGPETIIAQQPLQVIPNPTTTAASQQPQQQQLGGPMFGPPQQGAQGGATFQPGAGAQPPGQVSVGQGVTNYLQQGINQPGQLSSVAYERDQEQANMGLNTALQGIAGQLATSGIDPSSPLGQSMVMAATLNAGQQRSEAARDYSLAQEALKREDLQQATQNYLSILSTIFGLQAQRAQAAAGTGFTPAQAFNPYSGLATGLTTLGYGLADYFKGRNATSNSYPSEPARETTVPGLGA
jgi:hypothetical protein